MHPSRKGAVWMAKKKDTAPKVDTKGKRRSLRKTRRGRQELYRLHARTTRPGGAKDFRKPKGYQGHPAAASQLCGGQ